MQQANFPSLSPRLSPTQQLQQFQQKNGLGAYGAPIRAVAELGAPGNPSGGNIPYSYGNDSGFGGARPNGLGTQFTASPAYPWMSAMPQQQTPSSSGIGGSTPFLSGIQQHLGQMFGQTPGLGFRPQATAQAAPQQQTMAATPNPAAYSQNSGGSMTPMTPWMTQQIQGSPYRNQMTTAGNSMFAMGGR